MKWLPGLQGRPQCEFSEQAVYLSSRNFDLLRCGLVMENGQKH